MEGNSGLSRASLKTALRNCAEPAPVPLAVNITDGAEQVVIQGLLIHPTTGVLFAPILNTGTVLVEDSKDIAPSGSDNLGTLTANVTVSNAQAGDTYAVYLLGQCARKVFAGIATVT